MLLKEVLDSTLKLIYYILTRYFHNTIAFSSFIKLAKESTHAFLDYNLENSHQNKNVWGKLTLQNQTIAVLCNVVWSIIVAVFLNVSKSN